MIIPACDGLPLASRHPRIAVHTPALGADCVRMARAFTSTTLRDWGVNDRTDDIVTVVSELLTNAWRHAMPGPCAIPSRRTIRLGLLQPDDRVLCAVADPSQQVPVPGEPDQWAESGRGLQVVTGLSDTWGYTGQAGSGKIVWAAFTVS